MNTSETVCVIIPAYRAAATIGRAVRSALAQDHVAQVIVVDDASKDDTAQAAQAADDGSGRLVVITQSQNAGPAAARNRALAMANTDWAALLDSDDYYLPGRIATLLASAHDADLIADDLFQVDEGHEDVPPRRLIGDRLPLPRQIALTEFVTSNVTQRGQNRVEMGFIKPLMRLDFLRAHAITYRADMRLGEDYELYVRALASGARFRLVPAAGYVSVVRQGSLSGNHTEHDLQILRDCNLDLMRLPGLMPDQIDALRAHYNSVNCRLQWRLLITAVKGRDFYAAVRTFYHPGPVPFYLLEKLGGEIIARTRRMIFRTKA